MKNKVFLYEGNYSKAYRVTRLKDKLQCVAKILKPSIAGMDEDQKASFQKEKEILKLADHPFLIEFIEDFEYQNEDYCIVTKYASGHNLTTLIQ